MGRKRVSPFKASKRAKRQYRQAAGVLTAPLTALAKAAKPKKSRGSRHG